MDYPFVVSCKYYEEKTKDIQLCEQAVAKWGIDTQILMAVEEMSELIKVLVKYGRNVNGSSLDEIIEEIVDTEIMLEQLKLIFAYSTSTNYDKYRELRKKKLERLEKLLQEALSLPKTVKIRNFTDIKSQRLNRQNSKMTVKIRKSSL